MQKEVKVNLERARFLTRLLDTQFSIFGIRFGIDPLLNFIPGLGTFIGMLTSLYLFWIALSLDLPKNVYFAMVFNIALDTLLGVVPGIGIVADLFYKANYRNLQLIEKYLSRKN